MEGVPPAKTGFSVADVEAARTALLAAAEQRTGYQFKIDETPSEEIRINASPTALQRGAMTSELTVLVPTVIW